MENLTVGQYNLIYNAFSFSFATLAAATLFFWLGRSQVIAQYKTALTITGLVTFIAAYHYFRIGQSWSEAYEFVDGTIQATGVPFNDAYRYVDWLLTVPLLLIELILVMGLSRSETISRATRLGVLAALMVALGYPGEIATSNGARWMWGILSMIPFLWIIYELFVGLSKSISDQPENARSLVKTARNVTVLSWAFYPVVYFAGAVGLDGSTSQVVIQVGYTIADIIAKAGFGVLIFLIAVRKSDAKSDGSGSAVPAE
ncbi:bacteriorhodopsin [Maribius pontilimi]|uniref:Bacteriorhodopsin n=1 Tax=Palleronia pontilimi TaxID=1964209 RepID=A0A934IKE1_9RHOB|nr:bacteriorhodopsin-like [Palleronia pontilimi]MBJ3764563.1 bacteriorhodopsin [Palleronia pontilimi]